MKLKEYIEIRSIIESHKDDASIVRELLSLYKGMQYDEALKRLELFRELSSSPPQELVQRFKINKVEFGFIPDLERLTVAEYLDIDAYQNNILDAHKLMAVLYRPIKSSRGKRYSIEEYSGTKEYSKFMLEVDAKVYLSAIAFFLTLLVVSQKDTNTYLKKEKK